MRPFGDQLPEIALTANRMWSPPSAASMRQSSEYISSGLWPNVILLSMIRRRESGDQNGLN